MSRTRHTVVVALVAGTLAALIVLLIPRRAAEPPQRSLPAPGYLPPDAREALHRRMNHHGADLTELSWDVVLLDYAATRERAERVANEPALAPDDSDSSHLNSLLPERFYRQQSDMQAAALRLSQAAQSREPEALAESYGRLATTCVACHRVYLDGKTP